MHRFISSTPRKRPSPTDDGDNRSQPVLKAPTTATVSEPVPVTTATTSPCGSISAPKETSAPSTSARNMGTPKDISQTPEEGPRKGFLKASSAFKAESKVKKTCRCDNYASGVTDLKKEGRTDLRKSLRDFSKQSLL